MKDFLLLQITLMRYVEQNIPFVVVYSHTEKLHRQFKVILNNKRG